jgi:hypothetical protein
MSKNKETNEAKSVEVSKPLKWEIPQDMPILWTNNFVIQHTENEFILTFFQVTPPILIQPTREDIEAIESVPARAIARIALTPHAMAELLDVITENYERFQKKKITVEE